MKDLITEFNPNNVSNCSGEENSEAASSYHPQFTGMRNKIINVVALTFSAYQLYTAAFSPLSSLVMRSIHVGFLLLLTFLLFPTRTYRPNRWSSYLDGLLGITGFGLAFYHWVFELPLIDRSGDPSSTDIIVGILVIGLVFEAARRIVGLALPLICGFFVIYGLFGEYFPKFMAHRPYGVDQIINQFFCGMEGIYGTPILVSSTYIFLFILFGSFLEQAGMITLFTDIALGTVGHTKGGPAKVSVISSGLMGTINGSAIANVVTTGQFTIPLIKRSGYKAEFAGAVEATASMGGQIMPPVMGAVAFIMAETLNVDYLEVCKAAVIPAILYFTTVFWMVHLEARRCGLVGLAKSECPNAWSSIRQKWYLLSPLICLVLLLFVGYTPMFAGIIGLSMTVVLILGVSLGGGLGIKALRVVMWIIIGVAASAFRDYGIGPIIALITVLILGNLLTAGGRKTLQLMVRSLINGAMSAVGVGVACALVGVIIGTLTLTGAASQFAGVIVDIGDSRLLLSLVLTMIACLILGMGIPTIPNYIITSTIAAPALLGLGVPLVISHMFVFYFGIMADLTPPVALAAFAAAPIARAPGMKISLQCIRIGIAGFVVPFLAVYNPSLMLQGDYTFYTVIYVVTKALLAIGLWGIASVGFLKVPLSWGERAVAVASAGFLITAYPITDLIGFVLAILLILYHFGVFRSKSLDELVVTTNQLCDTDES